MLEESGDVIMNSSSMATTQDLDEETSFLAGVPRVTWWANSTLFHWKGFWLTLQYVKAVIAIESQFNPLPSDVLLVSFPKSGTTWLKALAFAILNQNSTTPKPNTDDPLLTHNPHELVPFLELETFGANPIWKIEDFTSPRLFSTHLPYSILPERIKNSGCRIVYLCRNPADTFVSGWHFFEQLFGATESLNSAFDNFCEGVSPLGPFFDHVLEYWKERERKNVFFLKYEELKQNPNENVKGLAEFLGCSLKPDEIEQVVQKCSHERLSSLEGNRGEERVHLVGKISVKFSSFFRKGVVGDSKNLLTAKMVERLETVAHQKLDGSGLEFKLTSVVEEPAMN